MNNFVKLALENGGSIHPLIIPNNNLYGPTLTNPTIFNDNGKILVNLRNLNYTLYHSEKKTFQHPWGPLLYVHPENDLHLRTWNYMCELDENLRISKYHKIDTSDFPDKELWEFVGLEDCRIVRWDDKLYVTGVRRDLDSVGTGRMELSELEITSNNVKEVNQYRIPPPVNHNSYCEKNWMPIIDMPFHYVKWANETEVVKYDIESNVCEQVVLKDFKNFNTVDLRGGSQVIPFLDKYRICLVHETFYYKNEQDRKDAVYKHRFVVWDNDWNIVKVSEQFSFLNAHVEFAVGICEYNGDYLITFGYQDNAAFLVKTSQKFLNNFIFN